MADLKISELTAASAAAGANEIPINEAGTTKKVTVTQIEDAISPAWSDWTPTFANFTKGSAAITAKYVQIGKTVHYRMRVVLAADSSMGTGPTFSPPVTSIDYGSTAFQLGQGSLLDSGTSSYLGIARFSTTTAFLINGINAAGTYATGTGGGVSSTAPMTWTTNDEINLAGTYEAA